MTRRTILAVNGGSSSLKCALFESAHDGLDPVLQLNVPNVSHDVEGLVACLKQVLARVRQNDDAGDLAAVGHRVVHGGDRFEAPVVVDEAIQTELQRLTSLAPLHQPANLELIGHCVRQLPGISQIACFDTAFHRHMPKAAREYALPRALTDAGVHAYGFHGISYEYIVEELLALDADAARKRIVIAHLGAGASLCAVNRGKSVATTMGFSTLDGLPMATRSGSVDPGVLLHLLREHSMSRDELEHVLYEESGLKGISGVSGDMRELAASPEPRAREAVDYFVYRGAREIGSLAGALGGLDLLVFTGGIGANDASVRSAICDACGWLGIEIDDAANNNGESVIGAPSATVEVRVIPTNEELQIARHAARLLSRENERREPT